MHELVVEAERVKCCLIKVPTGVLKFKKVLSKDSLRAVFAKAAQVIII